MLSSASIDWSYPARNSKDGHYLDVDNSIAEQVRSFPIKWRTRSEADDEKEEEEELFFYVQVMTGQFLVNFFTLPLFLSTCILSCSISIDTSHVTSLRDDYGQFG